MLNLHPVVVTLLFGALWLVADRFCGGGFGWNRLTKDHGGPLGGKPTYYAVPVLMALSWALGGPDSGPWFALSALLWGIYRGAFPWKLAGHEVMTPEIRDLGYAYARHAFPAIFLLGILAVGMANGWSVPREGAGMLVGMLAYAGAATWLAYNFGQVIENAKAAFGGDALDSLVNAQAAMTERIRGLNYGLLPAAGWYVAKYLLER